MLYRRSQYLEVCVAIDTRGQLIRFTLKDTPKEYQEIWSELLEYMNWYFVLF